MQETIKRSLETIPYEENCPTWTSDQPRYKRKHKWINVKGTIVKNSKKKGYFSEDMKCKKCAEVITSEGFWL
jgi:hypothetical protein